MRFCGTAWERVECLISAHCPQGDECGPGEICFTKYQCNFHDLTEEPTPSPTLSPILPRDHTTYLKFCGKTPADAVVNCGLDNYCGSGIGGGGGETSCPGGMQCFQTPPGRCNAFDMLYPGQHSPGSSAALKPPTSPAPTAPRVYDDVSFLNRTSIILLLCT